eukprot:COSAG04_NODE_1527_length_6459_cov_1.844025_2_plen_735_part_00
MASPFDYKEIGDPTVAGSKWGQTSGTSTDVLYPTSQLVDEQFKEGSTISFQWRSDRYRHWSARNTRLFVEYEAMYGECNETCSNVVTGPTDKAARPSRSLRVTSMPNANLFSSQARFVQNNVTVETTNHLYEQTQLQQLLTTNEAGTKTSGSNMLSDLSKSKGTPDGIMYGSQASYNSNAFAMLPVEPAPYLTASDDTRAAQSASTPLGISMGRINNADEAKEFTIGAITAQTAGNAEIPIVLSSTPATFDAQLAFLMNAVDVGATLTVTVGDGKFGAGSASTTVVENIETAGDVKPDGTAAERTVTLICKDFLKVAFTGDANKVSIMDKAGGIEAIAGSTVGDVSSAMVVKVKSDSHKDTTPNAKHEIIQQGYVGDRSHFQVSEPIIGLSTWNTNTAMAASDFQLHLTVNPSYLRDFFYDVSGQMGCPVHDGAAERFGSSDPVVKANQLYLRVKSVQLHVAYVHPAAQGGFIPKSISQKVHPVQVATRQIRTQAINESFTVPVSTVACAIFLRQQFKHSCADAELDGQAKAAAGINSLGITDAATGNFKYDSRAIAALRDTKLDPRAQNAVNADSNIVLEVDTAKMVEQSSPFGFTQLQVQLADSYAPREALSQMEPQKGLLSRAWSEYVTFISKNMGYRGSVMSYSQFAGYHNSNYASGPRAGERGPFFVFALQRPSGSLAVDLQVRALLESTPHDTSKLEMVVMAISESLYNVQYQAPSETPVATTIQPLV